MPCVFAYGLDCGDLDGGEMLGGLWLLCLWSALDRSIGFQVLFWVEFDVFI